MSALLPVTDPHWYRFAELHLHLQAGVDVRRQHVRGREWFLLSHPVTGRHYRLSRNAYEFIGRLDGRASVDDVWQGLRDHLGDNAPTQGEALTLMARLGDVGVLTAQGMPDLRMMQAAHAEQERREQRSALNPLAFRQKLLDPSRLLERLSALALFGNGWMWLTAWLVLTVAAVLAAVMEWPSIRAFGQQYWLTPRCFILTWLVYPFLKGLHELGHALLVRRYGGQVREAGITLFLLFPAPYVDASDATALPNKWQRAMVGAAGIMIELALASLALFVWLGAEPGLVRDLAFTVVLVGSLSTLLFNGNPLLRFDGYHVMTDVLELPNLATRSRKLWSDGLRRVLLGRKEAGQGPYRSDWRETLWLAGYAPASGIYRAVIALAIVSWVAGKSALLGLVVAGWLAYSMLLLPLSRGWRGMTSGADPLRSATFAAVAMLGLSAVLWIPLPERTLAPAVVWLPERALVRTATDGRVAQVFVKDGQRVRQGDALLQLDNPELTLQLQRLDAQMRAAEAEQIGAWAADSARAGNAGVDLERLRRDRAELVHQIDNTTLRAAVDGTVAFAHPDEWIGRDVPKGLVVARVLARDALTARAVIANDDIGSVRGGVRSVQVRLAGMEQRSYAAEWQRETPAASFHLPSSALADRAGGPFVTDPADPEGLTVQEPVFLLDVCIPAAALSADAVSLERIGARAWVSLEHPERPLAAQWSRRLRQTFLRHFSAND